MQIYIGHLRPTESSILKSMQSIPLRTHIFNTIEDMNGKSLKGEFQSLSRSLTKERMEPARLLLPNLYFSHDV